jgi:hypothetical protein
MTVWSYWLQPIEGDYRIREEIDGGRNHRIIGYVATEENAKRICDAVNGVAQPQPEPRKDLLPLTFSYKNHRGEVATRVVTPILVRFGSTEWHPELQWLLQAFDHEKQAEREFAMKDIGGIAYASLMTTTEDRIAWLEQRLRQTAGEAVQANDRIDQLEAALRDAEHRFRELDYINFADIARDALDQSSPRCANCGYKTKHEEALVNGEIWCHPCADAALAPEQDADIGCGKSVIEPWNAPEQDK